MAELSGRTALVTGAGQNVGAETARMLARHGARVIVNDLFADRAGNVAAGIRAAGGTAEPAVCDVTDLAAVREMVDVAGGVDILINNAGIPVAGFSMLPFAEEDPSRWRAFIDLNVYGPLNCTHAVLPGMIARGWGRVITISSESARVGDKRLSVYAASKGAGPAFMRCLAKEVGRNGITCNTLSLATQGNAGADEVSEMRLRQLRAYSVPRLGAPGDVAAAIAWLASDSGSWVTGQTIPVNGGYASS